MNTSVHVCPIIAVMTFASRFESYVSCLKADALSDTCILVVQASSNVGRLVQELCKCELKVRRHVQNIKENNGRFEDWSWKSEVGQTV